MNHFRGLFSALLTCVLILSAPMSSVSQALAQQNNKLQIRVVEGSNRILKKDESLELVVEVRDGQTPAAGAEVTFIAPEDGPGVLFTGNTDRLTVRADGRGRATSGRTRSIGEGAFSVAIVAMVQGNTATTTTQAANPTQAPSTAGDKKKSKKLLWILIGAAGAGAVAAFALKGSSDSDGDDDSVEAPTITVGPPTVGAPQ